MVRENIYPKFESIKKKIADKRLSQIEIYHSWQTGLSDLFSDINHFSRDSKDLSFMMDFLDYSLKKVEEKSHKSTVRCRYV